MTATSLSPDDFSGIADDQIRQALIGILDVVRVLCDELADAGIPHERVLARIAAVEARIYGVR